MCVFQEGVKTGAEMVQKWCRNGAEMVLGFHRSTRRQTKGWTGDKRREQRDLIAPANGWQKNRKLRIGADSFGLLRSSDGVCQGTMTQVCWTRYSATTLVNIGVFPGFARYNKR